MAEFVPSDFVSDGHKYGWRFAKVWGTENPKGNPIAHIMNFHQLKFKAEIAGKTYTLGARICYQNFDGSSQNILTGLNGYRSGSKSWLYVLYYDTEKPDAPDHKAGRPGTSIPSKITLEENEFICRLTVSTKSSDRAETTNVNEYSMGHMFAPLRASLADGLYSKWWCREGILDDDGWDFCFEFDQTTSPKITGFSVSLENTTPSPGIPTEENQLTEANGLYLYMDDQAEIQVGGCRTNQELDAAFDPASIKSIELAVTKPLELRYKHTDGTIYELKGGAEVDTSNLVNLDGEQTITGAKSFDAAVTLNAEGTEPQHAVTKSYVDSKVTEGAQGALEGVAKLDATQTFTGANTFSGATNFTGAVTGADPQNATELATKQYVDTKVGEAAGAADNVVTLDGEQTITGAKTFSAAPVISVAPTEDSHATNKAYVDSQIEAMASGGGPIPDPAASSLLISGTLPIASYKLYSTNAPYTGIQELRQLKLFTKDGRRLDFIKVPTLPANTTITDSDLSAWEGLQAVAKLVASDAGATTCERVAPEEIASYQLQENELKCTISYLPTLDSHTNTNLGNGKFALSFGPDGFNGTTWPASSNNCGLALGVSINTNLTQLPTDPVPLVRFDFEQAPLLDHITLNSASFTTMLMDYTFNSVAYKTLQLGSNGASSLTFEPAEDGHDLAQKSPQIALFETAPYVTSDPGSGLQAVNRSYVHRNFLTAPKSFVAIKDDLSIGIYAKSLYNNGKTKLSTSSSNNWIFPYTFALSGLRLETEAGPLFIRKYCKVAAVGSKHHYVVLLLTPCPCSPASATTSTIASDMKDYEFLVRVSCQSYSTTGATTIKAPTIASGGFFNGDGVGVMQLNGSVYKETQSSGGSSVRDGNTVADYYVCKIEAYTATGIDGLNKGLMPIITRLSCDIDLTIANTCSSFYVACKSGGNYLSFKQEGGSYTTSYTCTEPQYFGRKIDAFVPASAMRLYTGDVAESDTTWKTVTYNPYVSRPEYEALEARIAALESAAAGA